MNEKETFISFSLFLLFSLSKRWKETEIEREKKSDEFVVSKDGEKIAHEKFMREKNLSLSLSPSFTFFIIWKERRERENSEREREKRAG